MKRSDTPADEVCTTQRAAELLGISVSSVQQLVESGVIEAWKTQGGHRRIPLSAVLRYKAAPAADSGARPARQNGEATVLVVEDSPLQRAVYERQFAMWDLPVSLTFCENGYQALMEIARRRPQVMLADIIMDGIDGYEVVKTILADPQLAGMHIAIVSSLTAEDLAERGGVPPGVVFFGKPVNYDELRGYLRACCAQLQRAAQYDA
ncbi:response regulator [Rugamonas sp. FT107W]|uniref:Response regulator n=1 Tax=Duganella vulcania TaxID=2692166 RepID=A0A845HQI1_9BURK|nr:response regulator [Duganella vulcania]MYN20927.1 response regulator [Duganella vulcania]